MIRLSVMLYIRFPLTPWKVEDLLCGRDIEISHETVRYWWSGFRPALAAEIRGNRVEAMRGHRHWDWDEIYLKINGVTHCLWRAVDHEGEVLESLIIATRDRKSALHS